MARPSARSTYRTSTNPFYKAPPIPSARNKTPTLKAGSMTTAKIPKDLTLKIKVQTSAEKQLIGIIIPAKEVESMTIKMLKEKVFNLLFEDQTPTKPSKQITQMEVFNKEGCRLVNNSRVIFHMKSSKDGNYLEIDMNLDRKMKDLSQISLCFGLLKETEVGIRPLTSDDTFIISEIPNELNESITEWNRIGSSVFDKIDDIDPLSTF